MKTFLRILALALVVCSASAVDNIYKAKFVATSNPVNGSTIVVNGDTRTFVTSVTSETIQIQIGGSTTATLANLVTHLTAHPFVSTYVQGNDPDTTVFGNPNVVIVASLGGGWGTVAVTITPIGTYPLNLPLANEPAATRTTRANDLMSAFGYASTAFSASDPILANFVPVSIGRVITGNNSFLGANTYSNAFNAYNGGSLTNMFILKLKMLRDAVGPSGIQFETSGGLRVAALAPDANGIPSLYDLFATEVPTNALSAYTPAPENLLTRNASDTRYSQLASPNTFTGSNTFNALVVFTDAEGTIRNATISANIITDLGRLIVSNSAPDITFHQTTGAVDKKRFHIGVAGGVLYIQSESDDLGTVVTPFTVDPSGNIVAGGSGGVTKIVGTLQSYSGTVLVDQGNLQAGQIIGIGSTNILAPAGMVAGILQTNATTELSADPAHAVATWAANDEWKYRTPGAGLNYRIHNAAAQVIGAGTDYPLTGSYAQVTYGSGGNTISLPTAGTYMVEVVAAVDEGGTANDNIALKLYNATGAADIANSERQISSLAASTRGQLRLSNVITVTTATTLHLYAKNITAARGNVISTQTSMSYIRLY